MHIKGFDKEKWDELRVRAKAAVIKTLNGKIIATDNNPSAIQAARNNASTAGVEHFHRVSQYATSKKRGFPREAELSCSILSTARGSAKQPNSEKYL